YCREERGLFHGCYPENGKWILNLACYLCPHLRNEFASKITVKNPYLLRLVHILYEKIATTLFFSAALCTSATSAFSTEY
ncbi:MAG: hypothetical protein ACI9G1_001260, partial [Pirellulaceae bacterium]